MPRRSRVDANQTKLVKELRQRGWRILHLHTLRHGVPDLLGMRNGTLVFIEVKDGSKKPSARKLTPDEIAFRMDWYQAHIYTLESVEDIKFMERELDDGDIARGAVR